ncbi:ATP-dependent Clp protease proteolytic subunit [Streptomyces sp. NPDC047002]|uniref:ATP-dependent Clp protease proteolytic subunit n=1 Tax=Streptomyces sp. NPDC047002 TaxID=3155475 RepID=UPI0034544C1F
MQQPSARYVLPEFTERTSLGTRTLDPYSKLLEGRIVFLGTPVDEAAANDVIAQLLHLEYAAPDQDIALYLNSPGGSVTAMSSVYDTMRTISCDVGTTCLGQVASVAAVLLAAGAPGKRMALPGARIALQQPSLPEPVRGQPSDLLIHAEELVRQRAFLTRTLAHHTGREAADIEASLDRDTFLDAAGALEFGLVDHVVDRRAAGPSAGAGAPAGR